MAFNIDEERTKLIQVINDDRFDYLKYVEENDVTPVKLEEHVAFLCTVLTLTIKYPQVELYLKKLLNYFTVEELENITNRWSILHQMVRYPHKFSVNTFEIIINYGVNINIKSEKSDSTAIHILMYKQYNSHNNSILNLLIKYGAALNIIDFYSVSVLDILTRYGRLDEEVKNYIMILVDFGAKTCNPEKTRVYDFIEYYKNSTIKPATKNEK